MNYIFFPFLFFFLILPGQESNAQNLDLFFSSLMNFPSLQVITKEELEDHPKEISFLFSYNDFYRKQVNNVPVLKCYGRVWGINGFIPFSGKRFQSSVSFFFKDSHRWFQNRMDRTALYVKDSAEISDVGIQLAMTDGSIFYGIGFEWYSTDFDTPVLIKAFPVSKSETMHEYFLDWIEPNFGRQLNITGKNNIQKPILFGSIPIFQKKRLGFIFTHSSSSIHPQIFYANSSNKSELTGDRKIDMPFKYQENIIDISMSTKETGSKISAILFDSRFQFYLDNNPPPTYPILLDFKELGDGKGSRSGFSVKYLKEFGKQFIQFGLGNSNYLGKFDINSPVLGYYGNIFPISHRVKGKITGKSFSQLIEIGLSKTFFSMKSFLLIGYSHGFFNLKVNGHALLEFNLVSVPVHHPLQYHIHVITMNWQLSRKLGPVLARYSFYQFIPYIKRSDTSPIRITKEIEGVETKSRGGGIHQFVFSFQI